MTENTTISHGTRDKVAATRQALRELGAMVVAYSGGVDSSLLLKLAHDELGDRATPVYITSPTMVGYEKAEAMELAEHIGARVRVVDGQELGSADFCANSPLRCYHCRIANYPLLKAVADEVGAAVIVDGANLDDLGDYRPGRRAAQEAGIRSPLLEAGLTKSEIRAVSRELDLPTWDKPSMPCLASRIPYGTPVTVETLRQVERAEGALRALGFSQLRVRHHGDVARIELPESELAIALKRRAEISAGIKAAGYSYVSLDLDGFRSGSLNEGISAAEAS